MQVKDLYEINNAISDIVIGEKGLLPGVIAWEISEITDVIVPAIQKANKIKKEIQEKYTRRDDENQPIMLEINGEKEYDFGENGEAAEKEIQEIFEKKFNKRLPVINKEKLLQLHLSVFAINVLKKYNLLSK